MALFLRTAVAPPKKREEYKPGMDQEIEELVSSIRLDLKSCCSLLSEMENENETVTEALPELTDCLHAELSSAQRHVLSLISKLKSQGTLASVEPSLDTRSPEITKVIPVTVGGEVTTEVKDYEVFQAETKGNEPNYTKIQKNIIDDEDDNPRIGLSISLHDELKDAILKKADEHQEREAKALGIPVEEVTPHFFHESKSETSKTEEVNENRDHRSVTHRTFTTSQKSFKIQSFQTFKVVNGGTVSEVPSESLSSFSLNSFPSMLAKVVVEKGKNMNFNQEEECFGEDDNEEVEEAQENK
jgi:hypothetical protein